jgi:CHAD domain-containing protein
MTEKVMAYRLKKGRKLNRSLKKAADGQLNGAIRQLLTAGTGNPDGIHKVRTHLKKARAALRLIRDALDECYEPQNRAMRDAARRLAASRDDEVLLETFDRLTEPLPQEDRTWLAQMRGRLVGRQAAALNVRAVDRSRTLIELVRLKAAILRWPAVSVPAVSAGWKTGFKRARKGWREVERNGGPIRVHEWRKRVKTHWYHTRLLQSFAPEMLACREEQLRELSVLLGSFHDIAVLREQMAFQPADFGTPDQVKTLDHLAEAEQSRLLEKALLLGKELFSRKPELLTERK